MRRVLHDGQTSRPEDPERHDALLDPEAIAQSYLEILRLPRSAWTWEIEL